MAQRPRLEVLDAGIQPNQQAILQFRLWNESTDETLNVEQYRVTVTYYIDSAADDIELQIQDGYERNVITNGGVSFYTPNLYGYESSAHPTYIESGKKFNAHGTFRFEAIQSLPELPTGASIGGVQIRARRTDYKDYSFQNGNQGAEYVYEESWSYQNVNGSYSVLPGIALEYNPIDPTNPTSANWQVVQSWDDDTTPSPVVSVLPYDAVNGNTHFPTQTDHLWINCKADTWIDSNNPDDNNGTGVDIALSNGAWDGSGNSVRRGLFFFDLQGELPPSVEPADITDAIIYLHTDNSNQDQNELIEIVELSDDFNESDELTATWNNFSGNFTSTVVSDWLTFSNSYDQRDRLCIFNLSGASFPQFQGVGVKYASETSPYGNVVFHSREFTPGAQDEEPRLIIRYNPSPIEDDDFQYFVW